MKVSNVLSFAALIALIQAAGSDPAHAWTDEQLENRGNRIPVTSSPSVSVAEDSLLVLRKAGVVSGVASEITQVERQGAVLLIGLSDGGLVTIPYLTESNAEFAYRSLRDGASIDVSSCLAPAQVITSRHIAEIACTETTYTARVSCSIFSSTPLLSEVKASAYQQVSVANPGITLQRNSCRPHPGKI